MMIDIEQLAQLRRMRGCVGAALSIAETMNDTLLGALFSDVEQTITGRIVALVSIEAAEPALLPNDLAA